MWPGEGESERRKTKREARQVVVMPVGTHVLDQTQATQHPHNVARSERTREKKD
jgi:hypothetical protein